VFTGKVDNRMHRNSAVIDFARQLNVDVQISRLSDANLRELAAMDCEALVVDRSRPPAGFHPAGGEDSAPRARIRPDRVHRVLERRHALRATRCRLDGVPAEARYANPCQQPGIRCSRRRRLCRAHSMECGRPGCRHRHAAPLATWRRDAAASVQSSARQRKLTDLPDSRQLWSARNGFSVGRCQPHARE
jgi:hypothetical protein